MDRTQGAVVLNEKSKVVAAALYLGGVLFFLVGSIIALSAAYRSYVFATEDISV
ncbi:MULTISPECIES: hypothetical protein [unclassified Sporolactobacillus]|uniref:hypothetical protein n=1 Tax=unclassified Sporolactobacillus TaxID=2628533 RepID=UPI002368B6D4|nr:hypothetical protein [Sporolactobacillus sp. CQH2019]MDD9147561.1 hypothetical protein [Sporolactobacillus sp. CQH2019]